MLELGDSTEQFHREIGPLAAAANLDSLLCVGQRAAWIADAAEAAGLSPGCINRFPDSATVAQACADWLQEGDLVLLKGSRGMRLEAVAEALKQTDTLARKAAS
jgi:UDP-N-acetylmuramoyl-tripeptide--D-alanyl-D-alanine ligase